MALIIHNVDLPNSGNGDELREAFVNQNTMNAELYESKVDKVLGKDLSDQNYTIEEKNKLAGIAVGAEVNVQANLLQNDTTADDYVIGKEIITAQPTNTSQLINDGEDGTSAFITAKELTGLIDENENFVKKTDSVSYAFGQSGTAIELELPANGQSFFALTNPSLVSVAGFSLANITGNPSAEVPYIGKPYIIANNTGNNVTLLHDDTAENPFFFISGADIVIPSTGIIELRYDPDGINEVFKSWSELDLSTKADLVAGKVPSSQLPSYVDDVLEYANLAAFPVTGETGKIYVTLDTNFTYRWSGSAYVQIGNTIDLFNPYNGNYRIGYQLFARGTTGAATVGLGPLVFSGGGALSAVNFGSSFVKATSPSTSGAKLEFNGSGLFRAVSNKFIYHFDFVVDDSVVVTTARMFVGLNNNFGTLGNVNPSTMANCLGVGCDASETNLSIIHNDSIGTATKFNLGANFPSNSKTSYYRFKIYFDTTNFQSTIKCKLERYDLSFNLLFETEHTITTDILSTGNIFPMYWRNNETTASAVSLLVGKTLIAENV